MAQFRDFCNFDVRMDGTIWNIKKNKASKLTDSGRGYLVVTFNDGEGNYPRFGVHRVIAETFIPNPNNYPNVCHKDDNPSNNHVNNLFWGTQKMNMEDKMNKGRGAPQDGKNNPRFGKTVSKETRALMSLKSTGRKYYKITCPHCNKTGGVTGMKRWHFENCRKK